MRCRLPGIHGAPFEESWAGPQSARSFLSAVFTTDAVTVRRHPDEPTGVLTTTGSVSGVLLGGNQDVLAIASGWTLPSLAGAILLLEGHNIRAVRIALTTSPLTSASVWRSACSRRPGSQLNTSRP